MSFSQTVLRNLLNSDNMLVRMLAILDRRIGKRTLEKIKQNTEELPEWLQFFYKLRFDNEDLQHTNS